MKRTLALGLLAIALVGCGATMGRALGVLIPAYGVTPELAQRIGCDYDSIQARAAYYRATGSPSAEAYSPVAIPEVGMDHCEVLAMLGAPDRQTETRTAGGTTLTWYYQTGNTIGVNTVRHHIVQLQAGPDGRPVVSAVVW